MGRDKLHKHFVSEMRKQIFVMPETRERLRRIAQSGETRESYDTIIKRALDSLESEGEDE